MSAKDSEIISFPSCYIDSKILNSNLIQSNNNISPERTIKTTKKKRIIGICLVISISICWTFSTQFSQYIQTQNSVKIPSFALAWFTTSFKILCIIPVLIHNHQKQSQNVMKENSILLPSNSDDEISLIPNNKRMIILYFIFYTLWMSTNYCYLKSLSFMTATIVTALFSSNNLFIYLLSIFILDEIFSYLRMLSIVIGTIGILLCICVSSNNWNVFQSHALLLLPLLSAIFASFYKVLLKKIFCEMNAFKVCEFLFFIGLINVLFAWPIIILLDSYVQSEKLPMESLDRYPWLLLIGNACIGLLFDFLINFGICFTYPIFISVGILLGIPLNLFLDYFVHHVLFSFWQIFGILFICAAFIIIVITDNIKNNARK